MDTKVLAVSLALVLVLTAAYLNLRDRQSREELIKSRVAEAYELTNPGASITGVTLIPEGGVYRVVFDFNGQLMEAYVDLDGRYIFPVWEELGPTVEAFRLQKDFFECLAGRDVVLYGQAGSNATMEQFQALWGSMYVNHVYYDCTGERLGACLALNITSVPTWVVNGTQYVGVASVEQLEVITGCTYGG